MMQCTLCQYSWCWICGIKENSIIHYVQLQSLCQLINAFLFEMKIKKIYKIPLFITLLILSPLLYALVIGILMVVFVY